MFLSFFPDKNDLSWIYYIRGDDFVDNVRR